MKDKSFVEILCRQQDIISMLSAMCRKFLYMLSQYKSVEAEEELYKNIVAGYDVEIDE